MSPGQADAIAGLAAALVARFRADGPLTAMTGGRVHDGQPRAPVLPYLAVAEARGRDLSDGDGPVTRVALTLEAATADDERDRALAILARALALSLEAPTLPAGRVVLIRHDTTQAARLKDGRGWRASAVVDAIVE